MKIVLGIVLAVLVGAVAFVYAAYSGREAELSQLRGQLRELEARSAETDAADALKKRAAEEELTLLRKDKEELLRLRNETRQLREDKKRLEAQAQTAVVQAQNAQAQAQTAQAQVQAIQTSVAQAAAQAATQAVVETPEMQALRARYGLVAGAAPVAVPAANACINNLRQIDGAKQQWALENRKTVGSLPTAAELAQYPEKRCSTMSGRWDLPVG